MTQIDLVELDATEQAAMVRARTISARDLVAHTLARIDDVDPHVNAFRIVMTEQALLDAEQIDRLPDDDLSQLQLAGVATAIKDDTDVAGQSTFWGSSADRGICTSDAEVVSRLRRAGAVIIGKTNVPELTLWPWTATDRWGVTRNPWDLSRTAGGSSGGSAAAVCTGMAAMALGSDGGGSVRYPAGLTGLVGLKPQRGRVPLGPEHASGWHGLVVLGPLTRSVRDAALFLEIAGFDTDTSNFVNAVNTPPDRLRIAVCTNPPPGSQVKLSKERRHQVNETAALIAGLGHEVCELEVGYGFQSLWNSTVRFLKGVQHDVSSMPDQGDLEARTRSVARMGRLLPDRSLRSALRRQGRITASINKVFDNADVVLTPLCESPAPRVDQCPSQGAVRSLRAANTSAWLIPWNLTGQPALVIPTGLDDDHMPTAIQVVGRPGAEAALLSLALQIDEAQPFPSWTRASLDPRAT